MKNKPKQYWDMEKKKITSHCECGHLLEKHEESGNGICQVSNCECIGIK